MTHLGTEDKSTLMRVARDALEAAVLPRAALPQAGEDAGALAEHGACFVTLRSNDSLRGCIGSLDAIQPLALTVRQMCDAAALRDPRFSPVGPEELAELHISISVLGPLRPITDPSSVAVGTDGVVVERGDRRGVLLPQVATDQGWDRETFLGQTCIKAGLDYDAFRSPDTSLWVFSAEVVEEAS